VASVAGTATTFTDTGLASRTTYNYRVRAQNSAGLSPYSKTASARTTR
jgi:chitodextrinase